jgi:hypothetical protein
LFQGRFHALALLLLAAVARAQAQDRATLAGQIVDATKEGVPGVAVKLVGSGGVRETETDAAGIYVFDNVPSGAYTLEASKTGYTTIRFQLDLAMRERRFLRLQLSSGGGPAKAVELSGSGPSLDLSTGALHLIAAAGNVPLQRRDLSSLVELSPHALERPAEASGPSAMAVPPEMNYATLDGVSVVPAPHPEPGTRLLTLPERYAQRSPASLQALSHVAPVEAIESVVVQTGALAPEFSHSPGVQTAITSRSGRNGFHGAAYEYARNDRFNAADWLANSFGLGRGTMRYHQFGGAFGGPVTQNGWSFFAGYDGSRGREPETSVAAVPTLSARSASPLAVRPYLGAFPLPAVPAAAPATAAPLPVSFSKPFRSDAVSLRLDQRWSERTFSFLRYSYGRSHGEERGGPMLVPSAVQWRDSWTHAATVVLRSELSAPSLNELRVNYSRAQAAWAVSMDSWGGAVPLADSQVFPRGINSSNGAFRLMVPGLGAWALGDFAINRQQQLNVVESFSKLVGRHQYRFGVDYRRLAPTYVSPPYSADVVFRGLSDSAGGLLSGKAASAVIATRDRAVYPVWMNLSFYMQDNVQATSRTTLLYGFRWDITPPPGMRRGPRPLGVGGTIIELSQNEPLYPTKYYQIAPRLGLAYQMDSKPGRELIFRLGAGAFYDIGFASMATVFTGAPYASVRVLTDPGFPLTASDAQPPAFPPKRPFGFVSTTDFDLRFPAIIHWTAGFERMLGRNQALSMIYLGNKGRRLIRFESERSFTSKAYDVIRRTVNEGTSTYNGIQIGFRRRSGGRFLTQVSYTLGRASDRAPLGVAPGPGFATVFTNEWADSDFDVRHLFNGSGSVGLPGPRGGLAGAILGGWWLDFAATGRSGLPFDVLAISKLSSETKQSGETRRGLYAWVRPDYTGQPLWIEDQQAPGGRRINPAALVLADKFDQGTLRRNALRGFPLAQINVAVRREVGLREGARLSLTVQALNAFNHSNFADPLPSREAYLGAAAFGMATRLQSSGIAGAARTLQFGVRLLF